MTDPPPVQQRDDGAVLIQGEQTLALLYRSVLAGIARRHRDGLTSPDLLELARALRRAHDMSRTRPKGAGDGACRPDSKRQNSSDLISVAEAAGLLRLSKRQVQRLAANPGGLDGVRVGRTWALVKAPVLARAEERRRHDDRTDGSELLAAGRRAGT